MRRGKTALFIDGSNLHATTKKLELNIDYKLLLKEFGEDVINTSYFTAVEDRPDNPLIKLVDWLSFNGFTVVRKSTKEFFTEDGVRKIKGNMDVEIAVMAMELSDHVNNIVLFTGDGDFLYLVQALQRRGVFVTVVSSIKTKPSMIADELRRAANDFIEISTLPIFNTREKSRYG